jgi:glycosyltransferase involved in cell wall biosynthesis
MRVLMTADTVGGVWTYAIELMRALEPHGVRFLLATMGRKLSPSQWSDVCSLNNVEVAESEYRLEWMPAPWEDVSAAGEWLLSLAKRFRPDIVHLNGYAHACMPFNAPVLVVGHSCVLSWWRAVKGADAPRPQWEAYANAVRTGLNAADMVAAPTAAMLAELETLYGPLPKERLSVLPNCRDTSRFASKETYGKERFLFSAGRLWDEAKNVRTLCDAAAKSGVSWPVVVAGETTEPGREADTASICSAPNVRFVGALAPESVAGWMRRAAIYALPARYEPFGLSALEAALSGCALVLGNIPSLREVWGDAALYVAPDDADALATAISRLIEDESARANLAADARERAHTLYTPERTANAYLQVYGIK